MPDTAVAAPPPQAAQPGGGAGGGSGIGQLLRDPEHYEEISVIGNGEWGMAAQVLLLSNLWLFLIIDVSHCLRAH